MVASRSQEVEFKWGLPSEQAQALFIRKVGGKRHPPMLQVNHFFDTDRLFLYHAHHALRLRETGSRYLVTLKGAGTVSQALTVRPEVEWVVERELARAVLRGDTDPVSLVEPARRRLGSAEKLLLERLLEPAGDRRLVHIGKFENMRRVVETALEHEGRPLPARFEVDTVRFDADLEEYEIELEVEPDQAPNYEHAVRQVFASLGIEPTVLPSKAERFFDLVRAKRRGDP